MVGETGTPIKDVNGNIVGYVPVTVQNPYNPGGITLSSKLNYPNMIQQYNQQNYANVMGSGGSGLTTSPQSLLASNPGAYASNTLGIIQQSLNDNELNVRKPTTNFQPQTNLLPVRVLDADRQISLNNSQEGLMPPEGFQRGNRRTNRQSSTNLGEFGSKQKPIKKQKKTVKPKFWGI